METIRSKVSVSPMRKRRMKNVSGALFAVAFRSTEGLRNVVRESIINR